MANNGMEFQISLYPFTVYGTTGYSRVKVFMHSEYSIDGRAQFDELIEKLERLRDEVCRLNGWEGVWNFEFKNEEDIPFAEE